MVNGSFSRCTTPELPPAPPLPGTSQSVRARRLSRQPSVSTAAARNGVYLEWEQGSEDRRLADGSQTEPDAMSCSGFPKGSWLSPWAVTHSTTYTHTCAHRHAHTDARNRRSNLPAGVWCLTACFLYVLYRLSSEPYWRACKCSLCLSTTSTWTPTCDSYFKKQNSQSYIRLPSSSLFLAVSCWLCYLTCGTMETEAVTDALGGRG